MKIYEIGFDYANYDVIFTFKINKDASFFFSKEELDRYFRKDRFYEEANLKRYVEGEAKILDVTLLDVYKDKYISVYAGEERIIHKKKKILAPGEMEEVLLEKAKLKNIDGLSGIRVCLEED